MKRVKLTNSERAELARLKVEILTRNMQKQPAKAEEFMQIANEVKQKKNKQNGK